MQRKHGGMQRRKLDERVRRTHQRLGSALVSLIQEKSIDDVTVQEVLDRASVGRSTFYLHFRDKRAVYDQVARRAANELLTAWRTADVSTAPSAVPSQ